jgi:hypothetical protein
MRGLSPRVTGFLWDPTIPGTYIWKPKQLYLRMGRSFGAYFWDSESGLFRVENDS